MRHMGGMTGQNVIARLAGQYPDYIITHFKNFKARAHTNDTGNMTSLVQILSEGIITNLSHRKSSLYYLFQLRVQSRRRPAFFDQGTNNL